METRCIIIEGMRPYCVHTPKVNKCVNKTRVPGDRQVGVVNIFLSGEKERMR